MSNIVLVHGTYAGGFMWKEVAARLREKGHRVWTPTLTGVGERRHLNGPSVGLQTHVQDIENVLFHEDIQDAVVLGFSYGGMVLAGLGEEAADRVRSVILLDAALPNDGESIHDVYSHVGGDTLPPEVLDLHALDTKPEGAPDLAVPEWLSDNPRMAPMPVNCHWDKVTRGPVFTEAKGYYVLCTQWSMNEQCADRAAALGWEVWPLDAPHGAMDSDPDGVAELIDRAAQESAAAE
ncbi:alpha/beta fold hydrolase [Leucobacter allii]|uniref:alpha/beta hydrolase n=1 Tax=Leucobacter allii TaxID=2932247 RepID=UPI001FCFA3A0|nr:alpha/beta hydrolase family protein [Leucobacter allii]UOR02381.1 alpha/beta fold hydrolase [Leucobacter allii]